MKRLFVCHESCRDKQKASALQGSIQADGCGNQSTIPGRIIISKYGIFVGLSISRRRQSPDNENKRPSLNKVR